MRAGNFFKKFAGFLFITRIMRKVYDTRSWTLVGIRADI